jgi:glutamate formiminotransferase/formiminotetrahydrofolate cyclodeaminase
MSPRNYDSFEKGGMMAKIVECVPNFSEGRREEVVREIVAELETMKDIIVLDKEMDPDHNRSVVTFAGPPEAVKEAAFQVTKKASELIDLTKHEGEHPRMGATDVIPFVPISGITVDECVDYARQLGERIANELNIPIYLYERAATRPERKDLAKVRAGQFEGLLESVGKDPARDPDFGEARIHPTAGATAVGVRLPLVAYNVNLNTTSLPIAKSIAKVVRFRGGGMRFVKALGFEVKEKGCVQVSMNLTNFEKSPMFRIFEMVKREAERHGVSVRGSEIVGLVPQKALVDSAEYYLRLEDFSPAQILETRLSDLSRGGLEDFVDEVSSGTPTPGGGSVAALSGALGTALIAMVARGSMGKKKFKEYSEELRGIATESERLKNELLGLTKEDSQAFEDVLVAYRSNDEEKIEDSLKKAAMVPLEVVSRSIEGLKLAKRTAEIGKPNAITDVGCGALQLRASVEGAAYNVKVNLLSIKDGAFKEEKTARIEEARSASESLFKEVGGTVNSRLEAQEG